ncbi:MAG: hypothetical protein IJY82_07430 [Oscillospiraceae bacterium]|nr:hypothetical protein [Oscillospiraceae bacterium]
MGYYSYLEWMAKNTPTQWCNDSAIPKEMEDAIQFGGAIGCTSNPPLSYQALVANPALYQDEVAQIPEGLNRDDRALALIGCVVRELSRRLMPMYQATNKQYGYIRTQVRPELANDGEAMLEMGKIMATWGENVMVKIPGTKAGVWALEELAACGIATNPTVCIATSQALAVADAYERGRARAIAAGITPAPSTAAVVMGRLSDYMLQKDPNANAESLQWAVLAVIKNIFAEYAKRDYHSQLMPAAFRTAFQVSELSGAECCMTIHPKIQKLVAEADAAGQLVRECRFDVPVEQKHLDYAASLFPEFEKAYYADGLTIDEFDSYGPILFTLDGFDKGWRQLYEL